MTKLTEAPLYIVEYEHLEKLRAIYKKLYGDGSILTANRKRDLANRLNLVINEISNLQLFIGPPKGEGND